MSSVKTGKVESFREAFGEALLEIGEEVRELVVLDADVSKSTKTGRFAKRFPERFIQLGISEQDLVGAAAGLAIAGKIPVASTFSMFLLRAWEQIRNTIARDRLNVKFVATHAGLSDYLDGSSHQCLEDLAVMRAVPNMMVLAPADAYSTKHLLFDCVTVNAPIYMRIGRDYAPRIYDNGSEVKIGKINRLRDGGDVCIIACGVMVSVALQAADVLGKRGVSTMVLDAHTIKPLDEKEIIKAAKLTNGVIVAEEHSVIGGVGGAVAEVTAERYPVLIRRVGVRDKFGTCSRNYISLLEHYGLTVKNIVKAAEEILHEV